MPEQDGEKSQEATQYRRQQAREQGHVAQSQDLGSAALLLGALVAMLWLGGSVVTVLGVFADRYLGGDAWLETDVGSLTTEFSSVMSSLAPALLPLLLTMLAVAVCTSLAQVGLLFLPEKLIPDLTRIDPLQGFSRVFSLPSVMRLLFGLFKLALVAAVAYASLSDQIDDVLALVGLELGQIAAFISDSLIWTGIKIAFALLMLALFDYGFQWWRQEQDLRMTTQEVREEMRNLQGDPQVIGRRRAAQRQLVLGRVNSAVPKADVVITNPTELAIAVQYDPTEMAAPIVVAKGAGVLATRIRKLALENGVPIVEKKPLAQLLYKEVEINHPIPAKMYAAVAEILAYVYQLKGKKMPGR
ncbi:MAG TPA: EscU/YscU/HrcU family type III secretion system export apparatus switch protein [Pirellulales bacterium]|nr:EscU/YscU/HrcU family type III secretion system export apparatus switch protein [Pirellulales bacterium]